MFKKSKSKIDKSINFIKKVDVGFLEARKVQRVGEKLSIYVSSQTGCDHACRMCHLTSTGQTKNRDATVEELLEQFYEVFYDEDVDLKEVERVHINFMARGEPLSSLTIQNKSTEVFLPITSTLSKSNISPRFCVSTIMPKSIEDKKLKDIFPTILPEIYYSIYSVDPKVRKRWLPKAMSPDLAIKKLTEWQQWSNKIPKIHFPIIKGVNDSEESTQSIIDLINQFGLEVSVNIPSYNPNEFGGEEAAPKDINKVSLLLRQGLNCDVKYIRKVGFDVKASCGMFVV